ncbi:hypothetical protein ACFYWU_40380 [Streptomyces chrestomyceticus]|uniref:hypothetical protein n=1 Tax=Streptomyces chrestomyceticus TaxID=68185 RepID=UPI0036972A59
MGSNGRPATRPAKVLTALAAAMITALPLAVSTPAAARNAPAPADPVPRIDLRVLVVSDGGESTEAIAAELRGQGVPYTTVDLTSPGRPVIDAAFLSDTVDGRPRAKFQGVVLPNDNPFGTAASTELAALKAYETAYKIPQVDAYTYARPDVGLRTPDDGGYAGVLDGFATRTTAAGKAGPFGYLKGAVPFEDADPHVSESYGYVAQPLANPPAGATFTSYLDAAVPGTSARGSLIGEFARDGRRELVVTFAQNRYQQQFRLLARGIVDWLTQGVHLGQSRNYFSVQVDDIFAPDARWDVENNCTPGDFDCPSGVPDTTPIRMSEADAEYAAEWQRDSGYRLDMVYNAGSGEEWKTEHGGEDALADRLLADKDAYRWVNHTWIHPFLGCVQDTSTVPWRCAKDLFGKTRWTSLSEITAEIEKNHAWGVAKGLDVDSSELVTGEHSGLKTLPQQPQDNPNLGPALAATGVKWLASDNSRESAQRPAGPALTVPRYPMNVYYNVGKAAEEVDEYNWIYTSKADGGSGICETDPNSTCMPEPLPTDTGYASYIVPQEARTALGHALANDPRPHYIHQSNLAEDRIAYPVLDKVLADYRGFFEDGTPVVNQRHRDIGREMQQRAAWQQALDAGSVTAYRIGDTVTVTSPAGVAAAATMPDGTRKQLADGTAEFGERYAGRVSEWATAQSPGAAITLKLPTTA